MSEQPREQSPLAWAATRLSIAAVLCEMGQRENGTAALEASVAAYRDALEEFTNENSPFEWASAQLGLGLALRNLGDRTSDRALLERSIEAIGLAAAVYKSAGTPDDYEEACAEHGKTSERLAHVIAQQAPSA